MTAEMSDPKMLENVHPICGTCGFDFIPWTTGAAIPIDPYSSTLTIVCHRCADRLVWSAPYRVTFTKSPESALPTTRSGNAE